MDGDPWEGFREAAKPIPELPLQSPRVTATEARSGAAHHACIRQARLGHRRCAQAAKAGVIVWKQSPFSS